VNFLNKLNLPWISEFFKCLKCIVSSLIKIRHFCAFFCSCKDVVTSLVYCKVIQMLSMSSIMVQDM